MKIRIYKVKNTGEIVVDTPSNKYQGHNNDCNPSCNIDHFSLCPHPWRFRESNPNKEDFELEIKTREEMKEITQLKNESGSSQFYYDESGVLRHDHNWDECLMPDSSIIQRHKKILEVELDQELEKESPDPVKVIRKDRELKKLGKLSEQEVYELALSKLEAEGKKPKIQEKLRKKLGR